jgi:hypothetical protein
MEEPACTMLLTMAMMIALKQYFLQLNLIQLLFLGWFLFSELIWCSLYIDLAYEFYIMLLMVI